VPTFIGSTLIAIAVSAFPRGLVDATAGVALAALCRIAAVRLFRTDRAPRTIRFRQSRRRRSASPFPSRKREPSQAAPHAGMIFFIVAVQ
jgi:hypothetical protein